MSWSPELRIGELRPWPDSVHVMRGKTDEKRRYLPERECHPIRDVGYYRGINGYCEGLRCSECDEPLFSSFRWCPWCGAKVVN